MTATTTAYTFKEFLETPNGVILKNLKESHLGCMNEVASDAQIKAWIGSIKILKTTLFKFCQEASCDSSAHIVFEYELPRERGRRPDVLLLFKSSIIVLEFKEHYRVERAFSDQVAAYAKDLNEYHQSSHHLSFVPILLMASLNETNLKEDNVAVLSPENLLPFLLSFWQEEQSNEQRIDFEKWLQSDYAPLPSLVQAARLIFKHEPLPSIRRAESAGIPQTLKRLHAIANQARKNKEHHLALITGVPGAGKTLVGISFVYEAFDENEGKEAVLLSGNGPLVEVLQYALRNSIFVQDVHGFLKRYGGNNNRNPSESIFIYDEAQRAWDREKVKNSPRGHDKSEPEDFLIIGSRRDWSLMVGLIGEGQEIHIGEEAGIPQWNDAIKTSGKDWVLSCPSKLQSYFTNAKKIEISEELNLTQSLRSHLAKDVQSWVNYLLEGQTQKASSLVKSIYDAGFDIYVTRNLNAAKSYLVTRYQNESDKRYGFLASSKGGGLPHYGVHNDFQSTQRVKKGPWYIDDKDSTLSCCQLNDVMTEFGCQGLELDFPLVCWGDDFIWNGSQWIATRRTIGAKDNFQLRKNSYRVLLSRGRDGMILFIPSETKYDPLYNMLLSCGLNNRILK